MPQKSRGGNQGKQKENYCSGESNEREQDKKRWTRILTSEKYRFCASLANKVDTMGSGEDGGSSEMQSTVPSPPDKGQGLLTPIQILQWLCKPFFTVRSFFKWQRKMVCATKIFFYFLTYSAPAEPHSAQSAHTSCRPSECLHQREKREKKPTFSSLGQLDCLKASVEQMTQAAFSSLRVDLLFPLHLFH